jgi:hypothetical protein
MIYNIIPKQLLGLYFIMLVISTRFNLSSQHPASTTENFSGFGQMEVHTIMERLVQGLEWVFIGVKMIPGKIFSFKKNFL